MSERSAFDQNQVAEEAYIEPSGVLDQLNLPPGVVNFLRKNSKIIQIVAAVVVILVVVISLYNSYRTNRLESAAGNLAQSMAGEGEARTSGLKQVMADFSGTPSAHWAGTELGHMAMKEGQYKEAVGYYTGALGEISISNPMHGLLTFAVAQAEEAGGNYDTSFASYVTLKGIDGYKDEGYLGMARIYEAQGKKDEAIGVYEEYLGTFLGESENKRVTDSIQEKITRLRVQ